MPYKFKTYLASSSPRRKEILAPYFQRLKLLKLAYDEPQRGDFGSMEDFLKGCVLYKLRFAQESLKSLKSLKSKKVPQEQLVIVGDTVVAVGQKVFGKPGSLSEASQMLQNLSGKTHFVHTAYAGAYSKNHHEKEFFGIEKTKIQFHKLSPVEIKNYVAGSKPLDKAGAYGIQEESFHFIKNIEGSYLNVMGFPALSFMKKLKKAVASCFT